MIWNTIRVVIMDGSGDFKFNSPVRTDYSLKRSILESFSGPNALLRDETFETVGLRKDQKMEIKKILKESPNCEIKLIVGKGSVSEIKIQDYDELMKHLPDRIDNIYLKAEKISLNSTKERIDRLNQELQTEISQTKSCNLNNMENADFVDIPIEIEPRQNRKQVRFKESAPSNGQDLARS